MVQLRRYDITFFDRDLGSYTLHWVAAKSDFDAITKFKLERTSRNLYIPEKYYVKNTWMIKDSECYSDHDT